MALNVPRRSVSVLDQPVQFAVDFHERGLVALGLRVALRR